MKIEKKKDKNKSKENHLLLRGTSTFSSTSLFFEYQLRQNINKTVSLVLGNKYTPSQIKYQFPAEMGYFLKSVSLAKKDKENNLLPNQFTFAECSHKLDLI